jgi:hypothetical protein
MYKEQKMTTVYRIYPTLWEGSGCSGAQTVYACDRAPPSDTFPTQCSQRPKEDPASTWDSPTFQRLLPPPDVSGCCYQPPGLNAVTWAALPAWISWIMGKGFTIQGGYSLSQLKPHADLWILGPL